MLDQIQFALIPPYMYRLPDDHFSERNKEWYHRARGKLFGHSNLYNVAKLKPYAGDSPWKNVTPLLKELARLLQKEEGPFLRGSKVTYADLCIASFWTCLELFDRDGDFRDRVMDMDPAFLKHEAACEPWFRRVT